MKITVKDKEFIPRFGTEFSAGMDLCVLEHTYIIANCSSMIHTGIHAEIPEGHFGLLCLRSSMGKKGFSLVNTVGIIDSDYRGEIIVHVKNNNNSNVTLNRGDRIAQLIIVPYVSPDIEVVDELSETVRGSGGFGSTGV